MRSSQASRCCGLSDSAAHRPVLPGVSSDSWPLSWWYHPSHPVSSPSPPALNLSQHQGLFQRVVNSHQTSIEILNVFLIDNTIECMMRATDTLPRKTPSHALTVLTGTHQIPGKLSQGGHGSLDAQQCIYWRFEGLLKQWKKEWLLVLWCCS